MSAQPKAPGESGELSELLAWLRIPSISGDRRYAGELVRGGRWLTDWLRDAGAETTCVRQPAAPLVCGRFRGTRRGQATSVLYGHYDVQPPGDGWTVAPFAARPARGRVVARGASDDKGQLFAHLVALRSLARDGALGGDVLVVADGGEEIGSPGLADALRGLRARPIVGRLPARAVVISDTQRAGPSQPAITVSQRGMVKLEVVVNVGGRSVHPGRYAGAVIDPTLVLGRALARAEQVVARVPPALPVSTAIELAAPTDAELAASAGGRTTLGAGGSRHARLTTRAAISVTRMRAGSTAAAIPTVATASVDVRLPPGLDPRSAAVDLVRAIRADPSGAPVRTRVLGMARGLDRLPPRWLRDALDNACLVGFGVRPVYLRSGGSVPAVAHLSDVFGAVPALLGLGPPDDNAHGPDEYLDVENWVNSIRTCRALWTSVTSRSDVSLRVPNDSFAIATHNLARSR